MPDKNNIPCNCDQKGIYCKRHKRYARPGNLAPTLHRSTAVTTDDDELLDLQYERCGGGRRVIRKRIF